MLDRAAVTSNPRSQRLMATRDDFSFMLHVGCGLAGWLWNHVLSLLRDPSGRSSSSKVTLFSGQRKRAHRSGTAHTLLNLTLKVCGTTPYIPRGQVCHPWAGKPRPQVTWQWAETCDALTGRADSEGSSDLYSTQCPKPHSAVLLAPIWSGAPSPLLNLGGLAVDFRELGL